MLGHTATIKNALGQYLSLLLFLPSGQAVLFLQVVQEVQPLPWDLDVQQVPLVPPSLSDPECTSELVSIKFCQSQIKMSNKDYGYIKIELLCFFN